MVFKIVNLFDFLALKGPEHLKLLLLLLEEVVEVRGRDGCLRRRRRRRRVRGGLGLIVVLHQPAKAEVQVWLSQMLVGFNGRMVGWSDDKDRRK